MAVRHTLNAPSLTGQPGPQPEWCLDGTPIAMGQGSWLGLVAPFGLALMVARYNKPRRTFAQQTGLAATWYGLFQAAYLVHTLGHIRSARRVGAPMDAVKLTWGFQTNVYNNDAVSPDQHIGRALGGPLSSGAGTVSGFALWQLLRPVPVLGELAAAWFVCNLIMLGVALLPSPHFDATPLLRWSVIKRTGDEKLAEDVLRQAGWGAALGIAGAALAMAIRGRWLAALVCLAVSGYVMSDLVYLRGAIP